MAATKPSRDEERDRKRAYIDHVIKEAPRILAAQDGRLDKEAMRRALRSSFVGALPSDEANAYGWGFRRLTEAGVIEPASKTDFYAASRARNDAGHVHCARRRSQAIIRPTMMPIAKNSQCSGERVLR